MEVNAFVEARCRIYERRGPVKCLAVRGSGEFQHPAADKWKTRLRYTYLNQREIDQRYGDRGEW